MQKLRATFGDDILLRRRANAVLVAAAVAFFAFIFVSCAVRVLPSNSVRDRSLTTRSVARLRVGQCEGEGKVIRVLADDLDGSRHQRFIVQLASGQTLLITHNIDIAPRISGLKAGDSVSFNGEYV